MVGGYYFANEFASFGGPIANCDVSNVDTSKYSAIVNGIPTLRDGTYDECVTKMKAWFEILDLNKDQSLDRCEDAQFLVAAGNTEEYALTFGGMASVSELTHVCSYVVPTAFDDIYQA